MFLSSRLVGGEKNHIFSCKELQLLDRAFVCSCIIASRKAIFLDSVTQVSINTVISA